MNDVECLEQQEDALVPSETSTTDVEMAKTVLEAALLTAQEPMSLNELRRLFEDDLGGDTVRRLLEDIRVAWTGRGVELVNVASGWRFRAKPEMQGFLDRLNPQKPPKYSRAVLETLAIVAYRQPVTRGDIEDIRGVAVSSNIVKVLESRGWIEVIGHREVPGRPALYATTRQFLDDLALRSVEELPALEDLGALVELNGSRALPFEAGVSPTDSPRAHSVELHQAHSEVEVDVGMGAPLGAHDFVVREDSNGGADLPDLAGPDTLASEVVAIEAVPEAPASAEAAAMAAVAPQVADHHDAGILAATPDSYDGVAGDDATARSVEHAENEPNCNEDEDSLRGDGPEAVDTGARD